MKKLIYNTFIKNYTIRNEILITSLIFCTLFVNMQASTLNLSMSSSPSRLNPIFSKMIVQVVKYLIGFLMVF